MDPKKKKFRLRLRRCKIPCSFHNVPSASSTIKIINEGAEETYQIPPGSYTTESLVATVASALPDYDVSYDGSRRLRLKDKRALPRFVVAVGDDAAVVDHLCKNIEGLEKTASPIAGQYVLKYRGGMLPINVRDPGSMLQVLPVLLPDYFFSFESGALVYKKKWKTLSVPVQANSDLAYMLGFRRDNVSLSGQLQASDEIKLNQPQRIYVSCNIADGSDCAFYDSRTGTPGKVLCILDVDEAKDGVLSCCSHDCTWMQSFNSLDNLEISLTDERNCEVQLSEGVEWFFALEIFEME